VRLLGKLSWIEAKLFVREPLTMIFTFAFPFFMLFVLAGVFGNEVDLTDPEAIEAWRGVGPVDYYAPAYVALVLASIGLIALPMRLATYRERGVLRRFHAAGMPQIVVIGSQVVVAVALVIVGAIGIALTANVIYGAMLPENWLASIGAFTLGMVCFIAIGLALGAVMPTARAAQGAGIILFFVMMMLSGAGPPRGVLTSSMRAVSDVLPLTHVVLTLQDPWIGAGWDAAASAAIVAITAAAGVVAARYFRWD
jgi:ABC-2 type transport system permease protein